MTCLAGICPASICANEVLMSSRPTPIEPMIRLHNLAPSVWHDGEHERAFGLDRLSAWSALEMGDTEPSGTAFLQAAQLAGLVDARGQAMTADEATAFPRDR
jgi:hypothetical protein